MQTASSTHSHQASSQFQGHAKREVNWIAVCLAGHATAVTLTSLTLPVLSAGTLLLLETGFFPPIAQAYTNQKSVTVQRNAGEDYETFVRRAELAARAETQQIFDRDLLVTEVAVTVVGESGAIAVPVLTLQVSRTNWRNRPDPQRWAVYYRSAQALLELEAENNE